MSVLLNILFHMLKVLRIMGQNSYAEQESELCKRPAKPDQDIDADDDIHCPAGGVESRWVFFFWPWLPWLWRP